MLNQEGIGSFLEMIFSHRNFLLLEPRVCKTTRVGHIRVAHEVVFGRESTRHAALVRF